MNDRGRALARVLNADRPRCACGGYLTYWKGQRVCQRCEDRANAAAERMFVMRDARLAERRVEQ